MAAPTLAASYTSAWNSATTPKTLSVTTQAGDRVVMMACNEDGSNTFGTPTGNGLTYSSLQSFTTADYAEVQAWGATDAAGGTAWTLSLGLTGGGYFGLAAWVFRDSDGFGASAVGSSASGAPSLALTTTAADSAICGIVGDWNAADGTTRTWRTINGITPTVGNSLERNYFRDAAHYATYAALWDDAGAAGANTTGLSAPSGQKWSAIAVEVLGTATAANPPPRRQLVVPSAAVMRAAVW